MALKARMSGTQTMTAQLSDNPSPTAQLLGERSSVILSGSTIRVVEIELLASEWEGNASPYHQVVTIDGITEYSLVDLQPSVEQLSIFHNKDIAFTTENEDGVVTVYVIGDKPSMDYTIQATVSEVKL
jgi:hypothetical protein